MSDIKAQFAEAAKAVKTLSQNPGNDDLLELYALYKQSTSGDVSGSRPGMIDFAGRAKYDAWAGLQGVSADDAMARYIAKVQQLKAAETA